ncbi:peptide ABC transporter substrate-binding protein [Candidatus Dojkabacteria bacterium]|nr:peptide ABC transporter substrate-binding protein [Candidatus Dojkabacteria bacterium]
MSERPRKIQNFNNLANAENNENLTTQEFNATKSQYDIEKEQKNRVYWESPKPKNISIYERIRNFFWFYPDILAIAIYKIRPLSYLILYTGLLFLGIKTYSYASSSNDTFFNQPKDQTLYEGVVGNISMINPLFVTHNQQERDIQSLVFDKLIYFNKEGLPQPELAKTWAISADGKTYTFFLRSDVHWHDGERFTADDVLFTFETVKKLKDDDSYAQVFENVEMSKIDDFTIIFTLPEPNVTFMESLSIGIMPEHSFQGIPKSDLKDPEQYFNRYPIGTGPFRIIENTPQYILFERNEDYFQGNPKIKFIKYIFYPSEEDALTDMKLYKIHTISSSNFDTKQELDKYDIFTTDGFTMFLRERLIYVNLRNTTSILNDVRVREALSRATDRQKLVDELTEFGKEALGPIPQISWAFNTECDRYLYNTEEADKLLTDAGWDYKKDENGNPTSEYRYKDEQELKVTLTMLDTDLNDKISEILKNQWAEVGINLIIEKQDYEKIAGQIIPLRDFDLLLFEIEIGPDPDKYLQWDSQFSEYPGLNLSGYEYNRVDIILERARKETKEEVRKGDYDLFQKYIMQDMPAIYLYHPDYMFSYHESVKGIDLSDATLPQGRYKNVYEWYIE